MKTCNLFIFLTVLLFLLISCNDDETSIAEPIENPSLDIDFVLTFGGSNIDEANDIVEANDGGYVIVGATTSMDGDVTGKTTTDQDYWLLKLDVNGEKQWDKTYGGSENDSAESISKTLDGGYIIAGQSSSADGDVGGNEGFLDFWIVKVGSQGDIQWEKNFGYSGSDQAFDVFQTLDGGYFVTGIIDVTASNGEGNMGDGRSNNAHAGGDYWVMKLDASGQLVWSRYYGGSFTDTAYEAIETPNGDFIIVGFSDSEDVDITTNKGAYDFWIVRISGGEIVWEKNYGGSEIDIPHAITKTDDGNYLIVGDTRSSDQDVSSAIGNADIWALKINDAGDVLQQKSIGGTQFESARSIITLSNGNYIITSSSRSNDGDVTSNNGQNDIWTVLLNKNLGVINQKSIGGSNFDFGEHSIQTTDNKIITIGSTESNDGDVTTNKGQKDIIIAKFN